MRIWLVAFYIGIGNVTAFLAGAAPADQANGQVLLRDVTDFNGDQRTLRIYLPPGYDDSQQRYPVMYMHDAQNLFDESTAYAGEWQVDESLDKLASQGLKLIVVGIDHGEQQRLLELSPWTNARFGQARGEDYADFIVNSVKPWVDAEFRTLAGREHTGVMGSSMGGLMSHYLLLNYPQTFSKAGIFSPSYWYSDDVKAFTLSHLPKQDSRLFMLVGGMEGDTMQGDMLAMYQQLLAYGQSPLQIRAVVQADAQHNEAFWRGYFPQAVRWLFLSDTL